MTEVGYSLAIDITIPPSAVATAIPPRIFISIQNLSNND
ncbi:MAG: hypothetical protein J07HQW2_00404 [Haloquadratum walsbyi J07HQW2]|uniref:Uncharacterized protein n=1 Tax=Haloquadratum walsbyi J07HQW2 TaxID=1238425 RepID=U1NAV8_9EURY|nr:MAG: hypothetical protein J07HQW2_00404 [Haloquadratum walsbyi J07HQW2]